MQLLDCTLRDGGNVLGNGFPADLTVMMLEGLIKSNITLIEYGNAYGVGAYEADGKTAPLTDIEYMDLAAPYLNKAEIGMFIGVKNTTEENIALAAGKGMKFLRIGANAGDGDSAKAGIERIKKHGMTARYSLMKGYVLSADALAEEAKKLESWGLDAITIMDSAGTMLPTEVTEYTEKMASAVKIPVGFHGHNNLGLSVANAIAADKAGAASLDCGLLGMARSAGNLATEMAIAVMKRLGKADEFDFYSLLKFIDNELAPAMLTHGYKAPVIPFDLILGYAGCHSNFSKLFEDAAKEYGVDLYKLIVEVSAIDQKSPSVELIAEKAMALKA